MTSMEKKDFEKEEVKEEDSETSSISLEEVVAEASNKRERLSQLFTS